MGLTNIRLGDYIERSTINNKDLKYGVDLIVGVNSQGVFATPKGNTDGVDLKPYKIVENGAFVYNPTRLELGSIAYRTEGLCIVSHLYMVFYLTDKAEGKIIILNMICFEYLILAFDKLVAWTGTGKTDKIKIREEVLSAIEDHRINLSKIDDVKTLQYLAGFKRYSTERVMKSLVGEFTQNEKWSVKGTLMGECWYKDCCVSEHPDNRRCGKPKIEDGNEKMRMLIQSEEVHRILEFM